MTPKSLGFCLKICFSIKNAHFQMTYDGAVANRGKNSV